MNYLSAALKASNVGYAEVLPTHVIGKALKELEALLNRNRVEVKMIQEKRTVGQELIAIIFSTLNSFLQNLVFCRSMLRRLQPDCNYCSATQIFCSITIICVWILGYSPHINISSILEDGSLKLFQQLSFTGNFHCVYLPSDFLLAFSITTEFPFNFFPDATTAFNAGFETDVVLLTWTKLLALSTNGIACGVTANFVTTVDIPSW